MFGGEEKKKEKICARLVRTCPRAAREPASTVILHFVALARQTRFPGWERESTASRDDE